MNSRRTWGAGPWDNEPDEAAWTDEATGLPCRAWRNGVGAWCGYVGLPPGHTLYGLDYDAAHDTCRGISVHGGLTFAGEMNELPSLVHKRWWFGFDCAHAWDYIPASRMFHPLLNIGTVYRDLAYVQGECTNLARQCADAALRVADLTAEALAKAAG